MVKNLTDTPRAGADAGPRPVRWPGPVVCGWCKTLLRPADDPAVVEISHGICNPPCPPAVAQGWTPELFR